MEAALNARNEIVYAGNAEYGIYFCMECGRPAYLRKPFDKEAHFYHFRIEKKCSLCHENTASGFNYSYTEIQKAISILAKNTTKENWFFAIDLLLRYDQLSWLSNYEWAIDPINLYINNRIEHLDNNTFYKLLTVLIDNNCEKSFVVVLRLFYLNKLKNEEREAIIKYILKNISSITDKLFNVLIQEKFEAKYMLMLFDRLTKNQKMILEQINEYKQVVFIKKLSNGLLMYEQKKNLYLKFKKENMYDATIEWWSDFYRILIQYLNTKSDTISKTFSKYIEREFDAFMNYLKKVNKNR